MSITLAFLWAAILSLGLGAGAVPFAPSLDITYKATPYDTSKFGHDLQIAVKEVLRAWPNLYVLSYTNRLGRFECASYELASMMGYHVNVVQYWEVNSNAHIKRCGHKNIDKADGFVQLRSLAAADPTAVVLFIDSSDTFIQLPAEVVMERFLRAYVKKGLPTQGMMFVGTEAFCYPDGPMCHPYGKQHIPSEYKARGHRFKTYGWDNSLWPNSGAMIGQAEYFQHFFRTALNKKVENFFRNRTLYANESATSEAFQKRIEGSDQYLIYYGVMEAGLTLDGDYERDIFVCNAGDTWRHYTWLPTFGLWTQWTHLTSGTDDKLTSDTACSASWPPPSIRALAQKYSGRGPLSQADKVQFYKDYLWEAAKMYPKTPAVFHFNSVIKWDKNGMLHRWITAAFHAALSAIEYPTHGRFPYTVNVSNIGPEPPQMVGCDAARPLRTATWRPTGSVHVGMKLLGRELPLSDVCTASSVLNTINLPPL